MRPKTEEQSRLAESIEQPVPPWRKWGPYLAERSWGTVREDYSWDGNAWNHLTFEDSHKRAYRWGEDGIAGFCDRYQVLAFSPAFWNGKDPILKEKMFGLSGSQGNHGEDVKEYYYYLDATPSHSYLKYLYKYPQAEFPYQQLREVNGNRSKTERESELADTGVLKENRYFDIVIEYAKASPEDIYIRIEAFNRGPEAAPLHIIPQLWFRNQWAWWDRPYPQPKITKLSNSKGAVCIVADDSALLSPTNLAFDYHLGQRYLYGSEGGKPLFTDNESPTPGRVFCKEGFHQAIIEKKESVNPAEIGTKSCIHYVFESVPAQSSVVVYLRLTDEPYDAPFEKIEEILALRKKEADQFYNSIHPHKASAEERMIQRQALAGMIWTKQFYYFDVDVWFEGDNTQILPPTSRLNIRNKHWRHLNSMRVLSMPDKWEYPWFAAWDLAFHCLTLGITDIEFAKEQLWILLFDQFQHPNGAIPAYEWEFSDLNPPVQAWAAIRLYQMQKEQTGVEDRAFLKKCFLKLVINFTYWVNKVDSSGCNVFEGGFLGLDNITLVDRSVSREGAMLKQSDGTGWMAMFCLNLMRIALELSKDDRSYQGTATKFFQHFVYIADAMKNMGNKNYSMWDEEDGFFYDLLVFPDGHMSKFRVRSLVGLIPLYAVEIIDQKELDQFPEFKRDFLWFLSNRKVLTEACIIQCSEKGSNFYFLSLINKNHLERVLQFVWNPDEFRSDFGLRSLSKYHEKNPFFYKEMGVNYEPGETVSYLKGGNSNWRGPIWFPTAYLFIQSLKLHAIAFSKDFLIQIGDEPPVTIAEMAHSFAERMISIFKKDATGRRPFLNPTFPFVNDPYFENLILFNEYFHGDTGEGLGALHQTGWTGLVANLIDEYRK